MPASVDDQTPRQDHPDVHPTLAMATAVSIPTRSPRNHWSRDGDLLDLKQHRSASICASRWSPQLMAAVTNGPKQSLSPCDGHTDPQNTTGSQSHRRACRGRLDCVVNRYVLYYANVKKGCRKNGECIRTK